MGMFGRFPRNVTFGDVKDGLSNTIMAGETLPGQNSENGLFCPMMPVTSTEIPLNMFISNCNDDFTMTPPAVRSNYQSSSGYKSLHPGGANVVMGDGGVRFFPPRWIICSITRWALATAAAATPATTMKCYRPPKQL